jgi:hypothetical protein
MIVHRVQNDGWMRNGLYQKALIPNITLDLGLEVAMISYYGLIKDEDLTGSPADERHR